MRKLKRYIKILSGLCICVFFISCSAPEVGDNIHNTLEGISDIYNNKVVPGLDSYITKLNTEIVQENNMGEQQEGENITKPSQNSPAQGTERHAFLLEDDLVLIADLPVNLRYVVKPVYNYLYCTEFRDAVWEDSYYKRGVDFIGVGGEDSEDNFFIITVGKGEASFQGDYLKKSVPFVFQDGTLGEWVEQIWEERLHYKDQVVDQYEGIVRDSTKKYNIHLRMLKEEYDDNREVITDFLKSIYFRESDFGGNDKDDIMDRELITLHLWNEYCSLSLRIPEGVTFKEERCYNDDHYPVYSCEIYFSQDRKERIQIYSDQNGGILERSGDFRYYLNTQDFSDTVYEIPNRRGFYFPNSRLMIQTNFDRENDELWEYIKRIAQSVRFD